MLFFVIYGGLVTAVSAAEVAVVAPLLEVSTSLLLENAGEEGFQALRVVGDAKNIAPFHR